MQLASFFNIADVGKQRQQSGKPYLEFLRVPAMSAGTYVLSTGSTDPQSPHKEDEMYYVVRGRGRRACGVFAKGHQLLRSQGHRPPFPVPRAHWRAGHARDTVI